MLKATLKAFHRHYQAPIVTIVRSRRHSRKAAVMTKSKLSQGELVQQSLIRSPAPLIDVGVNLVDHSFDKVWISLLRKRLNYQQLSAFGLVQSTATPQPSCADLLHPKCTQHTQLHRSAMCSLLALT
jgi:hypothetical protein